MPPCNGYALGTNPIAFIEGSRDGRQHGRTFFLPFYGEEVGTFHTVCCPQCISSPVHISYPKGNKRNMNVEKHLILIKGEDKTEEVSYCEYGNGKWQVKFARDRIYSYNYLNVKWLRNPVSLDAETTVIYENNQPLSGVDKIFDFGSYIRICFVTGYKKVYRSQELTVEQSCLHNVNAYNCFEYLKKLAEKVSVFTEEDRNFLRKQYEKIAFVAPSSVLAKYLNPSKLNSAMSGQMPIFPFGFNLSQKDATEKALSEQISVIEGPPGTGKTQTILNIIANAIINRKTVRI